MQNNLLVAGIACIIAALVGGGLSGDSVEADQHSVLIAITIPGSI
ncbi:MAG TPA: hypothetical protein VE422_41400 [Terriglobia bacterium]|nr:hypothetical protein [Terriglobia bacterium]